MDINKICLGNNPSHKSHGICRRKTAETLMFQQLETKNYSYTKTIHLDIWKWEINFKNTCWNHANAHLWFSGFWLPENLIYCMIISYVICHFDAEIPMMPPPDPHAMGNSSCAFTKVAKQKTRRPPGILWVSKGWRSSRFYETKKVKGDLLWPPLPKKGTPNNFPYFGPKFRVSTLLDHKNVLQQSITIPGTINLGRKQPRVGWGVLLYQIATEIQWRWWAENIFKRNKNRSVWPPIGGKIRLHVVM